MLIDIFPFLGRFPRMGDKYLPKNAATVAKDCDLRSGEIRALHGNAAAGSIGGAWDSVRLWRDEGDTPFWLRFQGDVDVVDGPVADDVWKRIYFTGDTRFSEPRMSYTGPIQTGGTDYPVTSYKMGVPAPSNPPAAALYPFDDIAISAIFHERPIRIQTAAPHGLRSGTVVAFNILAAAPATGESDLAEFLNGAEFNISVVDDDEFTLDYSDAANIDYSAFTSGTVKQFRDPGLVSSRFYVFTYVNDIGEEGPPSEVSEEIEVVPGQKVAITLPGIGTDGNERVIETVRVYRTATGNFTSEFRFVAEVPIATLALDDELLDTDLGEVMESGSWDPPPAGLKGLRVTAQGVGVGFYDNVVCLSEPYRLHAWPTEYQYAMAEKVIAVEVVDNGISVTTQGRPYLLQGIDPQSMVPHRLSQNQACVSKRSMVTFGTASMYAAADGLVLVAGGSAKLLTENMLTSEDWAQYHPETIHAYAHENRYIGFYDNGAGESGGFIIDLLNPEIGIIDLSQTAEFGHLDNLTSTLYLVDDSGDIVAFDDPGEAKIAYTWQSKVFATKPLNFAEARVDASAYPVTFNVYGDGVLRGSFNVASDRCFALTSGYMCRDWTFEVLSDNDVTAIFVSDSLEEIP